MKAFRQRPYLGFIAPAFTVMGILIVVPVFVMVYYSLSNYEIGNKDYQFIGLWNYSRLLNSSGFWHSAKITVLYTLVVTSGALAIGYLIATLVDRHARLKVVAVPLLIVPIALTPSIAGQIWRLILNSEYGVLNYVLNGLFGVSKPWLAAEWAYTSVVAVTIWQTAPFAALILFAGIQTLPQEPFEAARVDGASVFQTFWHIKLPLLRMPIFLALIFVSIDALRIFDVPFTLTQGGPGDATDLMGMFIYRTGFGQTGWIGYASAASVLLMAITLALSLVLITIFRRSYTGTED